jgi:hypothetical protein
VIENDRLYSEDIPIPTVQDPNTYEFTRLIAEAAALRTIRHIAKE